MPSSTYTALATITLTGSDSEITFASIPATYRDLVIVAYCINTVGSRDVSINFNGASTTYSAVYMAGDGSSAFSGLNSSEVAYSSSAGHTNIIQLFDYAQTDKHKTGLNRYGAASAFAAANAFRWASTSAITSITLKPVGGTPGSFATGSTFSLYGIAS